VYTGLDDPNFQHVAAPTKHDTHVNLLLDGALGRQLLANLALGYVVVEDLRHLIEPGELRRMGAVYQLQQRHTRAKHIYAPAIHRVSKKRRTFGLL